MSGSSIIFARKLYVFGKSTFYCFRIGFAYCRRELVVEIGGCAILTIVYS